MKKGLYVYCILFFALLLLPGAAMVFTGTGGKTGEENTDEKPVLLQEDGSLNLQILSQAGAYFERNFGLRTWMITADALLEGRLLGTSPLESVVQGKNGWLYYADSLDDYRAVHTLSDRSLFNLAHTLGMIRERMEEEGRRFLFTVAPNKNTLYDRNMPSVIRRGEEADKNLTRLIPYLEKEGVPYADLLTLFREEEEVLYHARDSHWNNKGAALAADRLLEAAGIKAEKWADKPFEIREDFAGDLDKMLYPLAIRAESEIYYTGDMDFRYVSEVESTFDPKIETVQPEREHSLVMYRDSFGNALLPFMAEAVGEAYFSRGKPYDLGVVSERDADTVIIETAERFLPEVVQNAAVLTAEKTEWEKEAVITGTEAVSELAKVRRGDCIAISGVIDPEKVGTESRIFVRLYGRELYEAIPKDQRTEDGEISDCGFMAYIPLEGILPEDQKEPSGICTDVLISEGDTLFFVHKAMESYAVYDRFFKEKPDPDQPETGECDRVADMEVVG